MRIIAYHKCITYEKLLCSLKLKRDADFIAPEYVPGAARTTRRSTLDKHGPWHTVDRTENLFSTCSKGVVMSSVHNVLGIAGSLRRASTNKGLLRCAQQVAPDGLKITIADINDVPFYNADVAEQGHPDAVQRVLDQILVADALLLASTEYNYSMAPALKNILDWASRMPGNPALGGKPVAIMGAGGGMGTSRAQYHLRQTCVYLDMHPLNRPEVFSNAFSGAFDEHGDVTDPALQGQVKELLLALQQWIPRFK